MTAKNQTTPVCLPCSLICLPQLLISYFVPRANNYYLSFVFTSLYFYHAHMYPRCGIYKQYIV